MFMLHPNANLCRQQQIFQIWIRPVRPEQAHFALRLACYELDQLIKTGLNEEDFERNRNYLSKFVAILVKSQDKVLGYGIDSWFYGIPDFVEYVRLGLKELTLDTVNKVLRTYLSMAAVKVAIIVKDAVGLRDELIRGEPSPIKYDSAKPADVLAEDEKVIRFELPIREAQTKVVSSADVFERKLYQPKPATLTKNGKAEEQKEE